MKNFIMTGAAGYIAPRHLKAIKDTGNTLLAAYDPFDSVGILDSYFPTCDFFVEYERFDRHVDKLRRRDIKIDYLSVCSPNYLHDSHIRFGLKNNADVICEKPLVLNPWNVEALIEMEKETGHRIYNILQLRLHPHVIKLKQMVADSPPDKVFDFDLTYITSRGNWYFTSWKGEEAKSGGIATNIGVHFFDMLTWIFGGVKQNTVHIYTHDRAAGYLELGRARVRWFLSIDPTSLPQSAIDKNMRTYRSMTIGGEEIEFSDGFADLHTSSYKEIFEGRGFTVSEALPSIQTVYDIRHATPIGLKGEYHPFAAQTASRHPFSAGQ
jgi:UDP-N-acetyl-2-amino-2-deoxyglucuronate dehydrogenase